MAEQSLTPIEIQTLGVELITLHRDYWKKFEEFEHWKATGGGIGTLDYHKHKETVTGLHRKLIIKSDEFHAHISTTPKP